MSTLKNPEAMLIKWNSIFHSRVDSMTSRTKISTQGRTVIPVEIRRKLDIQKGEEVEWTLEEGVIMVRPVREEKTPDEIMNYLKNHPVEIKAAGRKVVPLDLEKRMMDEWARRKLGLTP